VILFVILRFLYRLNLPASLNRYFIILIAVLSVILTALMFQFDPRDIFIGRWWALNDWIGKILEGRFPYDSAHLPSGMPFLFILAMPCYLLGDAGLLQVCGFILFAIAAHLRYSGNQINKFYAIIFLAASPVFLFEVLVRSELIFNVTIVLLYFEVLFRYTRENDLSKPALFGLIGGLILSTRGIVLLIYIIFLGFLFFRYRVRSIRFYLFLIIGFVLTIVPFLLWNTHYFLAYGPFSVQLQYIPGWLLILSILASVACAIIVKTKAGAYTSCGTILFGVVLVTLLISVGKHGLGEAVMHDMFDTGYFAFALPFLVMSFRYNSRLD
jgi:hypothetical protein